jgi:hypothetical protein
MLTSLTSVVAVLSITSVIYFLIGVAVIVFLILGLKWLAAQLGWTIPQPMYAVLGFILFLVLVLYAFGLISGGPVVVR